MSQGILDQPRGEQGKVRASVERRTIGGEPGATEAPMKKKAICMTTRTSWLVAAVVVGWGLTQANAAYVDYKIESGGLVGVDLTIDGKTETGALTGSIKITEKTNPNRIDMPDVYYTVCTDLEGTLYLGYTYGFTAPQLFAGQDGLKPNWGDGNQGSPPPQPPPFPANAAQAIQNAAHLFYLHQGVLTGGTLAQKAALQLAVWEALYDTRVNEPGYGLSLSDTTSRFYTTSNSGDAASAISIASGWLEKDLKGSYAYTGFTLTPDPTTQYGLTPQGLLINVTPVPEPRTIFAAAMLGIPFGVSGYRQFRRRS